MVLGLTPTPLPRRGNWKVGSFYFSVYVIFIRTQSLASPQPLSRERELGLGRFFISVFFTRPPSLYLNYLISSLQSSFRSSTFPFPFGEG